MNISLRILFPVFLSSLAAAPMNISAGFWDAAWKFSEENNHLPALVTAGALVTHFAAKQYIKTCIRSKQSDYQEHLNQQHNKLAEAIEIISDGKYSDDNLKKCYNAINFKNSDHQLVELQELSDPGDARNPSLEEGNTWPIIGTWANLFRSVKKIHPSHEHHIEKLSDLKRQMSDYNSHYNHHKKQIKRCVAIKNCNNAFVALYDKHKQSIALLLQEKDDNACIQQVVVECGAQGPRPYYDAGNQLDREIAELEHQKQQAPGNDELLSTISSKVQSVIKHITQLNCKLKASQIYKDELNAKKQEDRERREAKLKLKELEMQKQRAEAKKEKAKYKAQLNREQAKYTQSKNQQFRNEYDMFPCQIV